ncbi:alpha/beta hydrolase [Paenibacillus koleovorans]|uniref:alpha/beta hydrolase n=1 Tax=Paenibacillus koleovorans TaxID=121608 RepID=UPI000FD805F0|nr:acetylxylan esterase [Paenibacillus koleovorans]
MQLKALESYRTTLYDVAGQLPRLIYDRSQAAFRAGEEQKDRIDGTESLAARQRFVRERLIDGLGGIPPSDHPLNSRVTDVLIEEAYCVEKVVFESRPQTFVTSNVYIPAGIASPTGAVLFLCGHSEEAKHNRAYQTVCQFLVRSGLIVLAMDPIGQGERQSYLDPATGENLIRWGTTEHDYTGTQCLLLGDSLARYFLHDAMRAIDYLYTRPDVDPARIGVTGNSGGGLQTMLLMMTDPRIAAAAPATYVMSRESFLHSGQTQDAEQIWPGMTAQGIDHEDALLCMAPRPVRVLAAKYDFFPIEGTRRTVERAKRYWELHGAGELLDLVEDEAEHAYTVPMAKAASRFFSVHLLGNEAKAVDEKDVSPLEPSLLWCMDSGQVKLDWPHARAVHEENLDRLYLCRSLRMANPDEVRKARALAWLKSKVFAGRIPCELNPRQIRFAQGNRYLGELAVESSIWRSQRELFSHGLTFRSYEHLDQELPVTIAIWNSGTREIERHLDWIRSTCKSGRAVLVLEVTGAGGLEPHSPLNADPYSGNHGIMWKLMNDLIWLDDSLAAMRTYDIIRALDFLDEHRRVSSQDTRLYAYGLSGIYAHIAAFLDDRVREIEVTGCVESLEEVAVSRYYNTNRMLSAVLPGMLQVCDLPELRRWRLQTEQPDGRREGQV